MKKKRIVIVRSGEFGDEGERKGHLSIDGEAQLIGVSAHITSIAKVPKKALIITSPTTVMKESAVFLKKSLNTDIPIVEDECWKSGMLENDDEKKKAILGLLEKAEDHDLVIVITSSGNIAALPQLFAASPKFKNYPSQSKSPEDGAFGLNFTGSKFGFEIRWDLEDDLGIVLEEIFVAI